MPSTTDLTYLYIGNFADMDTDEGDFDNENPNVVLGVHDGLALIDITQTDQDDNDQINDDEFGSGDTLTYNTGGGAVTVSQDSAAIYNADVLMGDGSTVSIQVIVVQAANGDTFISDRDGSLDDQAIQSIELLSEDSSNYSGVFEGLGSIDNATVVCYAPGTLIATVHGDVAVEALKPGDLVKTQDHGLQPIRWVNKNDCPLDGAAQDAKPVLVRAGALGPNRPAQDLIVSPNHRILVGGGAQLQDRFATEALAPAKALTSRPASDLCVAKSI
jgi:hypothetical protein